ncbi:DUF2793 domain-containing protein [Devosia sp. BSSL-BM10]|uniref:DUF2793 domain-containing protein n=1 Tax=Devosia litorisediminis TaxID=2829817 RepID=A0A942E9H6_9HYPH|nr:DUF2793 domain-containing protein [Devosia litorisediminis]MBS3850593.1 DUF2793 domain-containing protein [Devosia litorisediminis]
MDQNPRLSLPFIMPGQAQKHITHNQALQALDALVQLAVQTRTLTEPPIFPIEGETCLVPAGASGVWAGHTDEIASFQAGAWLFLDPAPGWQLYCTADQTQLVFDAGAWVPLASLGSALPRLGINTSADATNRLALASEASLFTHAGNGHQIKLNKATPGDTASLLFQTNWSGRAEMGLAGDDNWQLKLSADGASWISALSLEPETGITRFAGSVRPATDNAITLGASGARWSAIWSATGTIQTSDARHKTDIAPSDLGLDFVLALSPVRYRYRGGGEGTHYGLLAQDVQRVLDGRDFAGHVLADPADPHSEQALRYDAFIAPLIAAIQQLATRVQALEATP